MLKIANIKSTLFLMDSNPVLNSVYISAACNRFSHSLDSGIKYIAYSSNHAIVIYDHQRKVVKDLLTGHKDKVKTVRWIQKDESLISSSNDKTAIIWTQKNGEKLSPEHVLAGHSDHLLIADSISLNSSTFISCTASSDETLCVWRNEILIYSISYKDFIFDIKIIEKRLLDDQIIICFASGDGSVHLSSFNDTDGLQNIAKLKGHEDWVRCLDIISLSEDVYLIASGSQDGFIRVWRVDFSQPGYECKIDVSLETVLAGHEGWVCGMNWIDSDTLLTSSMDKTMIIWKNTKELWIEENRFGEISGNTFGFLGCSFIPEFNSIIGHSFSGSLHIWNEIEGLWNPEVVIQGHSNTITDIDWSKNGNFILSCSLDSTTRLHAQWKDDSDNVTWHEIGRPQIHGYEINCLSLINDIEFASGGDEKILRIFKATKSFIKTLSNVSNVQLDASKEELAETADAPALGLSNRAIIKNANDSIFIPIELTKPPTEEVLLQHTLWPEIQKLYGHGYEIYSVGCNNSGTILASACKASKAEHAAVIIWDIKNNFKQIQQLVSHQLTVTQIRFSHDDQYLLTVSRDRTWVLYNHEKNNLFKKIQFSDKKNGIHSRIIWDASWTPDSKNFITVSRDKQAIVWTIDTILVVTPSKHILVENDSILSVDVLKKVVSNCFIVALGLENGDINLYTFNHESGWYTKIMLNKWHHLPVRRVRFSPVITMNKAILGSAGEDSIMRLADIAL